jgi:hypothetical protein
VYRNALMPTDTMANEAETTEHRRGVTSIVVTGVALSGAVAAWSVSSGGRGTVTPVPLHTA